MNLNSNLFEDVKLVFTCGKTLLAHRLVLSAASPVLRELLQTSKSLVKSELVHLLLPDFDFAIMRQLVKLIYSGEVALQNGQLGLVVEYGRLLDIPAFREGEEKRLSEKSTELGDAKEKDTGAFPEERKEPFTNETELELQESVELAQTDSDSEKSQITSDDKQAGERADEDANEGIDAPEKVKEEHIEDNVNDSKEDSIETSNQTEILFYKIPQRVEQSKNCPDCDYKTKWMGDLRKHRLAKHEGLRHECDICNAKFAGKPNLRNHKLTKHDGVSFPCKKCDYTSLNIHQLRNHDQSKHEGIRYPCLNCEEKFIHRSSLKKHTMAKHLGIKFSCKHCKEEFPRQDRLRIHIRKCHEEGEYIEKRFYPCLQCEEKFKLRSTLKRHTTANHLGAKLTCQYCEKEFQRQYRLNLHETKCQEESKKDKARYPCPDCKETYRFQNSLKHHTMSKHRGIRYHCEYCAEKFRRQSSLKDHTKRCH